MPARRTPYWAFLAKPTKYHIERAIKETALDSWNVREALIQKGDRVAIWKAQGAGSQQRGLVALAEVVSEPYCGLDPYKKYWADPNAYEVPERRINMRYAIPPMFPLWLEEPHLEILKSLSVYNGQGTGPFHIEPHQWDALMEHIGGWPTDVPEIDDAETAVAQLSGKSAQGFRIDPSARQATEQYAMRMAFDYYTKQGWHVENVSTKQSYDLHCTRGDSEVKRVEVKGTSSDGSRIFLTVNEVRHAQIEYPNVGLFIVADIYFVRKSAHDIEAAGGTVRIVDPWKVEQGILEPLTYRYDIPIDSQAGRHPWTMVNATGF